MKRKRDVVELVPASSCSRQKWLVVLTPCFVSTGVLGGLIRDTQVCLGMRMYEAIGITGIRVRSTTSLSNTLNIEGSEYLYLRALYSS